jgi:hypothetical protein
VPLVAPSCYYLISISVFQLPFMSVSCLLPGILFLFNCSGWFPLHGCTPWPLHYSLLLSSTHSMFGYPSDHFTFITAPELAIWTLTFWFTLSNDWGRLWKVGRDWGEELPTWMTWYWPSQTPLGFCLGQYLCHSRTATGIKSIVPAMHLLRVGTLLEQWTRSQFLLGGGLKL